MKRLYLFLFLSAFACASTAQNNGGRSNWWHYGNYYNFNFNNLQVNHVNNSAAQITATAISMSDKQGNLLFYGSSNQIYNANNQPMQNGNLYSGTSTFGFGQYAVTLPMPCNPNRYFVFYIILYPTASIFQELQYSVVDMSLDNGLGGIDSNFKNIIVIDSLRGTITTTLHANNRDFWIMTQRENSNSFEAWLLSDTGLSSTSVISQIGIPYIPNSSFHGQLKFSNHGHKLANANSQGLQVGNPWPSPNERFELFDFDRATGLLSNHLVLDFDTSFLYCQAGASGPCHNLLTRGLRSVEFSPNDSILYAGTGHVLVQYDLSSNNPAIIPSAWNIIAKNDTMGMLWSHLFRVMQLGPDGKIYTNNFFSLSRINNPNVFGAGCNFNNYFLTVPNLGTRGGYSFPNLISNDLLNRSITHTAACVHSNIDFSLQDTAYLDSTVWHFADSANTVISATTLPISHSFSAIGAYPIMLELYRGCEVDTLYDTVYIHPLPNAHLGPDTILCEGDTLDLFFQDSTFSYVWSTGDTSPGIRILAADTYSLTVTSLYCGVDADTIVIDSLIPALVHLPNDTLLCLGDTLLLDATVALGSYLWNVGDTTPTFVVQQEGLYSVTATNHCGTDSNSIYVSYARPPNINLGNDSVLCTGDSLVLNATDTLSTYLWYNNSTTALDTVFASGIYWATATNLCGSSTDSIELWFIAPPQTSLGNDTVLCTGDSLLLADNSMFAWYAWSTLDTSVFIVVSSPGVYSLSVSNICGTDSDSIWVDFDTVPFFSLGNDTTLCQGDSLPLSVSFSRSTYLWNTSSTDSNILAFNAGLYSVTATNLCGSFSDSINLFLDTVLVLNFPQDTVLCEGDTLLLAAGVLANRYLWSTGSTQNQIAITLQDTYFLEVENTCGIFSDTIEVYYDNAPITNLGPDTMYCITSLVMLDATWSRASYLWQNGSTDSTHLADSTGRYWVEVTNLCGFDDDTVRIEYQVPISFSLGADTALCDGDSISLHANGSHAEFVWNTGSSDSVIIGFSGNTYWVRAENLCGVFRDSISLGKMFPPMYEFPDGDTLCEGDKYTVRVRLNNSMDFIWGDGYRGSERSFTESGTYTAIFENICGRKTESLQVHFIPAPQPDLGSDTLLCPGERVALQTAYIPRYNYLWSTGDTTHSIETEEAGIYRISVSNPYGCQGTDEIEVVDCGIRVYIPNAFTPNRDGINDEFKVYIEGVNKFWIAIYDRWGNEVFFSENPNQGWDGTHFNQAANAGTYTYKVYYRSGEYKSETRIGSVELIR